MYIDRFGIRLARLSEDRIEMVRQWRNSPSIRDFMEYREHITAEMQMKWFQSLHVLTDFYFVVEYRNEPVGLIHTSGIDWHEKTGHSGLFIQKQELMGTYVPVLASLSMVDFFFYCCNLETLYAKVMESNPVAIKYNAQLGFKADEPKNGKRFRQYRLNKDDYRKATVRMHESAIAIEGEAHEIALEHELFEKLKSSGAINDGQESLRILT